MVFRVIHVHLRHSIPVDGDDGHSLRIGVQDQQKERVRLAGFPALLFLAQHIVHIDSHTQEREDILIVSIDLSLIAYPTFLPFLIRLGLRAPLDNLRHGRGGVL